MVDTGTPKTQWLMQLLIVPPLQWLKSPGGQKYDGWPKHAAPIVARLNACIDTSAPNNS